MEMDTCQLAWAHITAVHIPSDIYFYEGESLDTSSNEEKDLRDHKLSAMMFRDNAISVSRK